MSVAAPEKSEEERYKLDDLIKLMRALREPEGGCPWDLEQDFRSIAPHTIEEAYEVADAIARGDMAALREELGDLLFQSIYHAQIAAEQNAFNIHDVIHDITAKMIFRHPHVFGEKAAASAADVNEIWDSQKEKEKKNDSAIDGVAITLPALLRAQKLQKRAARVGFEWPDLGRVLDKLEEETGELREALASGTQEEQQEELGDILFVLANFARMAGLNAETALRECNSKFERRFKGLENELKQKYKNLSEASLAEMEAAWNVQKAKEKEAF